MSSENRVQLQPAFLVHRKPYRDSSLLLELFTEDYGRIGLIAKGARSARSKLKGILQPYHLLLVSWSGRGELHTLTAAETQGTPLFLKGDALVSGFYLNELIMRLLARSDPHPTIFISYLKAITELANGNSIDWALRIFERDLLQDLGYGLLLSHEGDNGEEIEANSRYSYHHESGLRKLTNINQERSGYQGAALLALANGECNEPELRKECKRLMRDALSRYLGARPLASRELFRQKRSIRNEEE